MATVETDWRLQILFLMNRNIIQEISDETVENALVQNVSMTTLLLPMCLKKRKDVDPAAHIHYFVENTVPRYTPYQFKEHFRMHPEVFEALCQWIGPHLKERTISVEKKLLASLWLIANKESYRGVADRFGMNKGALHTIVMHVCRTLTSLRKDIIKWPQASELQKLADRFQERAGIPGVVGAIDGTYIRIPGPRDETRDAYICRKGFPAVQLQVVCNSDLFFLDIFTGYVGSVHDSRVFRNSDLMKMLESEEGRLPARYHLLGDSAYPLKDYLLVPFRDNGHLTPLENVFNKAHSSTRVDVERAIGLLKGKFRRLKDLDMLSVRDMPFVICAACVLHNFIIRETGVDEEDIDCMEQAEAEDVIDDDEGHARSGNEKRLAIASVLI